MVNPKLVPLAIMNETPAHNVTFHCIVTIVGQSQLIMVNLARKVAGINGMILIALQEDSSLSILFRIHNSST